MSVTTSSGMPTYSSAERGVLSSSVSSTAVVPNIRPSNIVVELNAQSDNVPDIGPSTVVPSTHTMVTSSDKMDQIKWNFSGPRKLFTKWAIYQPKSRLGLYFSFVKAELDPKHFTFVGSTSTLSQSTEMKLLEPDVPFRRAESKYSIEQVGVTVEFYRATLKDSVFGSSPRGWFTFGHDQVQGPTPMIL
ncbi:hypothetical protein LWI29_035758 [Acer saccharum]|uniref:Uncharacterized protein n=1 Tax=Acer saccharum TaxID=4024 RepID=A0AA39SR10_ACESA|nr:hypothetical protein LWI29_035758 [Acer saccharum]